MYMGEYEHSLDSKGRLIIPAKFREALGESFVLTRGLDKCLNIYDMEAWNHFASKLKDLPYNTKKQRELVRFFLSGACEAEPDRHGRILIPGKLRAYADIRKDAVLCGCGDRIEIWSRELYEGDSPGEEISAIAEELMGSGFII